LSNAIKEECIFTTLILFTGSLTGWLTSDIRIGIICVLLILLVRHLQPLFRLNKIIRTKEEIQKPYPKGIWENIYRRSNQRKKKNRKLKRNLKLLISNFHKASAAISEATITLDSTHRITWANPAAQTLLNIHWPKDSGQLLTSRIPDSILEEYLQQSDFRKSLDFSPQNSQNSILSLQITPFCEEEQQLLVVARDITQLFHLNQARRNFVSSVSHELKTPLTVLVGFLEAVGDAETLPKQDRPIKLMQQQAARMQLLIDDLLTLSKLEIENKTINEEPLAIHQLITEIVEEAKLLSDKLKHDFSLKIDERLSLYGNLQEIRSSFSNLLTNAVKYSPPKSTISIVWGKNSIGPYFSVSDNGEGIEKRHIPRLTERFYRIDSGRSRESGGTGLGLAIVKHALYRHNAELKISSKIGRGSTFSCQFPKSRTRHLPVEE
jgi:two-component system phosphate regulon sensor histidine kinase PhoR